MPSFISVRRWSTLYRNPKKKVCELSQWTHLDVNLKIATFWLIWNIASEVNSKLLQLNISRFFPWNCDITIIFLQSRSGSLWRSDRKQKCVITNDITGIENSNLGYKWQLYQTFYEINYVMEKLAKKYKEPCQITAMTQISIQDIKKKIRLFSKHNHPWITTVGDCKEGDKDYDLYNSAQTTKK